MRASTRSVLARNPAAKHPAALGELARLARIGAMKRQPRRVQRLDQGRIVAAGGLEHAKAAQRPGEGQQCGDAGCGIGKAHRPACGLGKTIQPKLGDIDSECARW